jgi:uncharacterized protein
VRLHAGTTEQFRADAQMHRIAEKLRTEYTAQIGHKPSLSEVASWQNSLLALPMLADQAELNGHGVILDASPRGVPACGASARRPEGPLRS